MKKHGFTMAEMLVTMGIIGVVATIMIPVIGNARPNVEMVMLKKAYYNTSRVVSELINDDELYPENDEDEAHDGFSNITLEDQLGHEARFRGVEYSGESKFCGLFAAKLNAPGAASPDTICSSQEDLPNGNFITADGAAWSMPVGSMANGGIIGVDVNGPNKGNNCSDGSVGTACGEGVAPDQFGISVGKYGEVALQSDLAREYIRSQNTSRKYAETVECMAKGTCK